MDPFFSLYSHGMIRVGAAPDGLSPDVFLACAPALPARTMPASAAAPAIPTLIPLDVTLPPRSYT